MVITSLPRLIRLGNCVHGSFLISDLNTVRPEPVIIKWSRADFEGKDVPEDAKTFLIESGLPTGIGISCSTLEFGIFDSDNSALIIGVDYEFPIIMTPFGVVEIENEEGDWFFNSSVQQLAACINVYRDLNQCDDDDTRAALMIAKDRIRQIDPLCMSGVERSVWRTLLDDFEVMA